MTALVHPPHGHHHWQYNGGHVVSHPQPPAWPTYQHRHHHQGCHHQQPFQHPCPVRIPAGGRVCPDMKWTAPRGRFHTKSWCEPPRAAKPEKRSSQDRKFKTKLCRCVTVRNLLCFFFFRCKFFAFFFSFFSLSVCSSDSSSGTATARTGRSAALRTTPTSCAQSPRTSAGGRARACISSRTGTAPLAATATFCTPWRATS